MAYDIHIFRGTDWEDGADKPITHEELLAVDGVEIADQSSEGLSYSIGMADIYSYGEAMFILDDGMINIPCRSEDVPDKMRPLAEALGAVIQGDDGEYY